MEHCLASSGVKLRGGGGGGGRFWAKPAKIGPTKYCYLNLTDIQVYQITGLNPTFLVANNFVSINGYVSGLTEIN